MFHSLAAWLGRRFLGTPRSHGAIGAVGMVSVAGVAVATAAVVCVLSVFNGFRSMLSERLDILAPDAVVLPSEGKTLPDGERVARAAMRTGLAREALPTVTDQALAIFGGREMPVSLKGVDIRRLSAMTGLDSVLIAGSRLPQRYTGGERSQGVAAIGTAVQLGNMLPGDELMIFAPRRHGRLNMANPLASFITDSISLTGVYETHQSDYDENTLLVPLEVARRLFQYTTEATSVEVAALDGVDPAHLAKTLQRQLGDGVVVKDRLQMQETNFKMVSVEKWVSFLLLLFILVIASFNIISTLTMLVLEKRRSMPPLRATGASRGLIGRIFSWQSVYVSLSGTLAGIALGLVLCLLQQHFGLLRLAGDPTQLLVTAYPVKVVWTDLLIVLAPCAVITAVTALVTGRFARSQASVA